MCMYTSSRGKSSCYHSKSEFQMFSLICGRHVGVSRRDMHRHGVSILSSITLRESSVRHIPETWRGCLFSFCHCMVSNLFFDGVTVKTGNSNVSRYVTC